ncbi:MAG: helicase associated domain-containing protein [Oligoflexales bacterium]
MKKLILIVFVLFEGLLLANSHSDTRFKSFQIDSWNTRYNELIQFYQAYQHVNVPHTYPANPQLARWVKRQRRQHKLLQQGHSSTLSIERFNRLHDIGFIWDSHEQKWQEMYRQLRDFSIDNGHCNVSSNNSNKKLATWVKCQRRQYKLLMSEKYSSMNQIRIEQLESIGFVWSGKLANNIENQLTQDDLRFFSQEWEQDPFNLLE